MASATDFIDNTSAQNFIPELWSQLSIVSREDALVMAPLVDRRFEDGLSFGDTIHVPNISNLAARTKSANTIVQYETVTETNVNISIGTNEYAAIAVESITKIQNNRDQLEMYSGKLGYALGLAVDELCAQDLMFQAVDRIGHRNLATQYAASDYFTAQPSERIQLAAR